MRLKTIAIFVLLVTSALGAEPLVPLPADLSGTLNGADYLISVPANWNGTLLVLAHGYGGRVSLPHAPLFLPLGYGLAASSFRNGGQGWAVQEGVEDTAALVKHFRRNVGRPDRIILYGGSMGGLITVASIEKHPGLYDGGVSTCGTIAGSPEWWDKTLAFAVAYDVAFGWPATWGYVGDVRDDLSFWDEVVFGLPNPADSAVFARWEFIRLVTGLSSEEFWNSAWGLPWPWMYLRMWQATGMRAEAEVRAGGPVAENFDHNYTLTSEEKTYLMGLGLEPDVLLTEMALRRNIGAHRPARNKARQWYEPKGNINRPVLTLHTTNDPGTPAYHESYYRQQVEIRGRMDLLVQVFTDSVSHCGFHPDQIRHVILAMDEWLETGERPEQSDFPESMGFVPGFVPPEWPY